MFVEYKDHILSEAIRLVFVESRRQRGLTQTGLSIRSNITRQFISQVEVGKRLPSINTICALANAYNKSLSQLFYEVDRFYPLIAKSLREEEGGTYGVGVSAEVQKEPKEFGLMEIYFNCNPDAADKLRDIVVKQLSDLAENGPDEEEFTKTLSNLKKNIPERRVNNSYWLGCIEEHERFGKDRDKGFEAAVNALTPEAVKAMAGTLLKSGNHIELVMRPQL